MERNLFLQRVIFENDQFSTTIGGVLWALILIALYGLIYFLVVRRWLPRYMESEAIHPPERRRINRLFFVSTTLFSLYILAANSGFDFSRFQLQAQSGSGSIQLRVDTVLLSLWLIQLSRLLSVVFIELFLWKRSTPDQKNPVTVINSTAEDRSVKAKRAFKWFVYTLVAIIVSDILDIRYEFYTFELGRNDADGGQIEFSITVRKILETMQIIFSAQLLAWLGIRYFLSKAYERRAINLGSQFAINQLFTYLLYFLALLFVLNVIGVNISVVVGGTAALLLGVGLGLQQTFNDFFSGILLLFERSVEVGDIVDVEGVNGRVKRIGLRSSEVQTRENMTVIVPNSKIVVNSITNWSHNDDIARFKVSVGVAYGSNTQKIKELLLEAVASHDKVLKFPVPFVRFTNFGASSLDFEVHFWTKEFLALDDVRSDIRFSIDNLFRKNGIDIPFPQQDVWIRPFKQQNDHIDPV